MSADLPDEAPELSGQPVLTRLQEAPELFSLEQVFRILQQLQRKSGRRQQINASVRSIPRAVLREVISISQRSQHWEVACATESLSGYRGVLPHYLRDAALALELESGDSSMKDFLALFESLWIERLVRGRSKYDLALLHESSADPAGPGQVISAVLQSLLPGGMEVTAPGRLIRFAGLLAPAHRHLEGLRMILQDYFQLRVVVRSATIRRHRLDPAARVKVGCRGRHNRLGHGTVLGAGGYLDSWRVDVLLLPQEQRQLEQIQAQPVLGMAVFELVRLYLGDSTPVAVYAMVRRKFLHKPIISSAAPRCRLGQSVCLAPERSPAGVVRIRLRMSFGFLAQE